ncbi:glycosyltransferase family 9 protein [Desulfococcus sp.]|uniref:glycosyltransferase family 9 protein n=1 Tax=Desulfococcus sp. TaxID=2025834 RepID=UPI00359379DC
MQAPAPLLVVHPGALGDLVATFANLLRLKQRRPGGIDGVCQEHLGRLAVDLGIFRRAFAVEAAAFAGLYSDAPGPAEAALAAFFRPYRAVVLFSSAPALEAGVSRVFRRPVYRIPPRPPAVLPVHIHDHVFARLAAAGLLDPADGEAPFPEGFPTLNTKPCQGGRGKTILIHPGSGSPRKNWPLERFVALACRLRREGMVPEFIAGPAEPHLVTQIREDESGWTVHAPAALTDLRRLLAAGDGYVGNDSGVSHLAAFLGVPTLALFGPSDPVRWQPRGRALSILTASGNVCEPCFEREATNCDGTPCLAGISVDDAADRLLDLLSGP